MTTEEDTVFASVHTHLALGLKKEGGREEEKEGGRERRREGGKKEENQRRENKMRGVGWRAGGRGEKGEGGKEEEKRRGGKGRRTRLHTLSFISWSCCCKTAMSGSETTSDRVADPPLSLRVLGAVEKTTLHETLMTTSPRLVLEPDPPRPSLSVDAYCNQKLESGKAWKHNQETV